MSAISRHLENWSKHSSPPSQPIDRWPNEFSLLKGGGGVNTPVIILDRNPAYLGR